MSEYWKGYYMGAFLTCVCFFIMNVTGITAYLERIGAEHGNKFSYVVGIKNAD